MNGGENIVAVTLNLPRSTYETLRGLAMQSGSTVTADLEHHANTKAQRARAKVPQSVAALHARNYTVGQIGAALDLTNQQVHRHLTKLGLTPNPYPRKSKPRRKA